MDPARGEEVSREWRRCAVCGSVICDDDTTFFNVPNLFVCVEPGAFHRMALSIKIDDPDQRDIDCPVDKDEASEARALCELIHRRKRRRR